MDKVPSSPNGGRLRFRMRRHHSLWMLGLLLYVYRFAIGRWLARTEHSIHHWHPLSPGQR
jgi:hypothetical protein